ncbi:MAG: hypothetical protein DCC58_06215 [Chloroflexi bacterium]|nr:MAG: hypothetical protein DCC58_06215 [Chloroflexota bacterium]
MRIVISHLTRMRNGHICVAGIDLTNGQHIRPVAQRPLTLSLTAQHGGPLQLAAVLELQAVRNVGRKPEVEDRAVQLDRITRKSLMPASSFWRVLGRQAESSLGAIFGPDLQRLRNTWVVPAEQGEASLGCLAPQRAGNLWINEHGRVRISIVTDDGNCTLPVTDLRLYRYTPERDYTPNTEAVQTVSQRLRQGGHLLLSVGLSRPFKREDDERAHHWLQVNNIFPEQDPLWDSSYAQHLFTL